MKPSKGKEEPAIDINDVFSMRKPKDFKAGLSSGVKSIAKGVVGGAVTLVAAPVAGAVQDGVSGFAKGMVAGVVGAVALPVAGISVGCAQIVRGGVNQVEATRETHKGKVWDQSLREWVDKPTNALVTVDENSAWRTFQREHVPPSTDPKVDFYELLQVPKTASPEQIKKSYYTLARRWHPDKNPDNPEAHERFQRLGEAYQVLCNEDLRKRYDAGGMDALDVNFMDSGEFFSMLFGCEQFEHLVGELVLTTSARMQDGKDLNTEQLRASQTERVEKLVVNLKLLLKRFEAEDQEGFKLMMQQEADRLVQASFGDTMLHTIGRVYEAQADIALGGLFDGTLAKLKHGRDTFRSQLNAVGAAMKVMQAQQKMDEWERKQEQAKVKQEIARLKAEMHPDGEMPAVGKAAAGTSGTGATSSSPKVVGEEAASEAYADEIVRQQMEEAALPLMLEAMWAANVLDIQGTVSKVCKVVLQDKAVGKEQLKMRAQALKEAGRIFQAVRPREVGGAATKDAKAQMEEAMTRVMEKRHAQDSAAHGEEASPTQQ